jgi:O-antigen/teichoic acid export membrane protein
MSLRHFRTVLMGDVAAKALTAALLFGLVRLLPPSQFASFVYQSSLMILSVTLLNGFFNRHYIIAGEHASPRAYRGLQLATACLVYVVIAVALARDSSAFELLAGISCAAAAANFDFRRTHAQKALLFGPYTSAEVARAFVQAVLSIPVVVWGGVHTVGLLLAAQAVSYLALAQLLPRLPSRSDAPWGHAIESARGIVANASSMALLGYFALVGLFGQLSVLMLKQYASAAELASFGSAFRYYGFPLGVVAVANVVILPRIAKADDLSKSLKGIVNVVLAGVAMIGLIAAGGYAAIPWIDAGKYPDAPLLFAILCTGLLPGMTLAPITAAFLRMDRNMHLLYSQAAAVLTCAATAWLFRSHGAFAAAWSLPAGVLAQLIWLLLATWTARKSEP